MKQPPLAHNAFAALFLFVLLPAGCFLMLPEPDPEYMQEITALTCAELEIQRSLTSPATADFGSEERITRNDDGSYRVLSYVDSQNSFGATVRTGFDCDVIVHQGGLNCTTECSLY